MLHNQDSAGTRHNIMSNLKNEVSRIISRTVGVVIQLIWQKLVQFLPIIPVC